MLAGRCQYLLIDAHIVAAMFIKKGAYTLKSKAFK
jgi:hypothetical protein